MNPFAKGIADTKLNPSASTFLPGSTTSKVSGGQQVKDMTAVAQPPTNVSSKVDTATAEALAQSTEATKQLLMLITQEQEKRAELERQMANLVSQQRVDAERRAHNEQAREAVAALSAPKENTTMPTGISETAGLIQQLNTLLKNQEQGTKEAPPPSVTQAPTTQATSSSIAAPQQVNDGVSNDRTAASDNRNGHGQFGNKAGGGFSTRGEPPTMGGANSAPPKSWGENGGSPHQIYYPTAPDTSVGKKEAFGVEETVSPYKLLTKLCLSGIPGVG